MPEFTAEDVGKLRPLDTLRGGDSLAPMTAPYAGTLGYFVKKKKTVGFLSNAHVMSDMGTKLTSPAKKDDGTSDDYIGTVQNAVVTTSVDCGYAPSRGNITKFLLKDGTSVTGTEKAAKDTPIKFFGRTSSLVTRGKVSSIDWTCTIDDRRFDKQILFDTGVNARVQPGDSGSLLINRENNKAIGLIFAEAGAHGVANHIGDVLEALDVEIAI